MNLTFKHDRIMCTKLMRFVYKISAKIYKLLIKMHNYAFYFNNYLKNYSHNQISTLNSNTFSLVSYGKLQTLTIHFFTDFRSLNLFQY